MSMLLELDMIDWENTSLFIKQFRSFDESGDGRLTEEDIQARMEGQQEQIKATVRRCSVASVTSR